MADEVDEVESDVGALDVVGQDAAFEPGADADADADGDGDLDEEDQGQPTLQDDTMIDADADADADENSSVEGDDQADDDIDNIAVDGEDEEAEEEEDDAEGVGAVKIKPGETDEEDSDSDSSESSASTFSDRESTAEWHDAPENEDDEEEEDHEDDESEAGPRPVFREPRFRANDDDDEEEEEDDDDEESDFVSEADAADDNVDADGEDMDVDDENNKEDVDDNSETGIPYDHGDVEGATTDVNGHHDDDEPISPTSARLASASQIARDLLPPQRGVSKPDAHSIYNQLLIDSDPMDGSRVLRKRKTSSAERELGGDQERDQGTLQLCKRRKPTPDDADEAGEDAPDAEAAVQPRSVRSLRLKVTTPSVPCSLVKKSRTSYVLKMRVNSSKLDSILSRRPKPMKRSVGRPVGSTRKRDRDHTTNTSAVAEVSLPTPFFPSSFSQPFYSFYDKETDELKGKPYGGILNEDQADTTKTLPSKDDRRRFDEAKQKAEEEWRNRLLAMQAEAEAPVKKSKKTAGPASQIECIEFGGWEIDTWYAAPYPEEYSRNRVLYICEFCLKYMNSDYVAWRHKLKCPAKHPPGDEIYRHGSISFFEVDGRKNPVYCQNLCLLAKLFLGSKTLYYDVEPFLFYVLCEYDDLGYHFVGYFSKEKRATSQNNVSCILTLPIHQRKGYGHLLIDFSYLLTRVEEKSGSPEKPLSDMGLVSYRNYWRLILCKYLTEHVPEDKTQKKGLSIRQISDDTGMTPDDVVSALEALRFLVRDPVTHIYAFRIDLPYCHNAVAKWTAKGYVKLNPEALTWTPYVMGRGNATNLELGPALNTIAPREGEEEAKPVEILVEATAIVATEFSAIDDVAAKPLIDSETAVLESTEPNDNTPTTIPADTKASSVDKENISRGSSEHGPGNDSVDGPIDTPEGEEAWQRQYENIPINRFQVFPPISKRPGMPRTLSALGRPPLGRAPSSAIRTPAARSRPRARRPTGGSSARKSSQRKSGSAKRKTGGTGRGPGRWPKGTKKSDYGNAASGPGLPPAWLEKQRISSITATEPDEDNELQDTVRVQVSEMTAKGGSDRETISAVFEVKDDVSSTSGAQSQTSGTNGTKVNGLSHTSGDEDVDMTQAVGDEEEEEQDAPGEEE
ncbi:hypothetical protein F5Y16DRAFT_372016 [Xylariaceae sp. FL0255]|nr:hypothetical protein F5Y16DRAFT_372016 [Xylariaceae sp. FL0255]